MTTPFRKHVERWKDCMACPLCHERSVVVLARGHVPCDVLFIGEAPGDSEDALGVPFIGEAGKLFDTVLKRSFYSFSSLTYALTNLVACFPREEKRAGRNAPPTESIKACADRLREFVNICSPRLIVAVGSLSERWLPKLISGLDPQDQSIAFTAVTHPAAILRGNLAQKSLSTQSCVVKIATALRNLKCH